MPVNFRPGVLQDLLASDFAQSVDVLLPVAAWAEKDGCWENFAGLIQPFAAAIAPPQGVRREADIYLALHGETGLFNADAIRARMGGPFASVALPTDQHEAAATHFVEL